MKRTLRASVFVAMVLVAAFSLASAAPRKASIARAVSGDVTPQATCVGGASLSGPYGMLVSGDGKYLAGALFFDGNCDLSGSNISGGSNGQYTTTSVTGTYTQNSDGTFTMTLNFAGQCDRGNLSHRRQRIGTKGARPAKQCRGRSYYRSPVADNQSRLRLQYGEPEWHLCGILP